MTAGVLDRPVHSKRRAVIVLAALGVALYMSAALATDATQLMGALRQLGWMGCSSVLALSCLNYLLRFYRWKAYLDKLGHPLPVIRHLLCYLSGFAFTVSPGKVGEAVRSFYLHKYGVAYSESIATLFVERLLDLLAIIVLASLAVLYSGATYMWLLIGAGLATLIVLIIVCRPSLPTWISLLSARRPAYRSSKWLMAVAGLLRSSQNLLRTELLLMGLLLGLLAWGAEGLGFHLICRGLELNANPVEAIGIYAVAALAGVAAVFLPAGIGGMEIVMTTLLVGRGASFSGALIATLLCRLATLWFAVLIGIVAAGILELQQAGRRLNVTS